MVLTREKKKEEQKLYVQSEAKEVWISRQNSRLL